MLLDVFNDDAFHYTQLVQVVNDIPYQPTRIRSLGLFNEEGVSTLTVAVEKDRDIIRLVPTAPRGAPAQVKNLERRDIRNFSGVHMPQRVQLLADEVQGLRAVGKQTEVEVAMTRLKKKMAVARRDLDVTIEHQRIGAVKGVVMDSDGTTVLWNYFTEFGLTRQTLDMALDNSATKVFIKNTDIKRKIEDKLGGVMFTGVRVFCSQQFFDALIGHDAVKDSYFADQQAKALRGDNRKGFAIGDVTYEEYRGQIGDIKFIPDGCAFAVPEGVPDLFTTYYMPPNMIGLVNTDGVPYYTSMERLPHDAGFDVLTQSNPLHICNRPNAIITLGMDAASLTAAGY